MSDDGALRVVQGGLDDPRVVALIDAHVTRARAETARGSAHSLEAHGLDAPDITFWSAWIGDAAVGVGALRVLCADLGEVKSMHTAEACRGRGVASALLRTIIDAARGRGLARLSLETGAWDYFLPSHALYRRHGFEPCPPFAGYHDDPNSRFFTLALR